MSPLVPLINLTYLFAFSKMAVYFLKKMLKGGAPVSLMAEKPPY